MNRNRTTTFRWKRLGHTVVSKIGFRTIVSKFFELPDGTITHFDIVEADNTRVAGVLALTVDGKVVIAHQFRPGPEMYMDEIPGGFVEPGEDEETAVRRELLEETGYEAGTLTLLGTMYCDAYTNQMRYYFLATDCAPATDSTQLAEQDDHEFIEVRLLSIDELLENARAGKMTDAGIVLLAYEKLQALKRSKA